MDYSQPTLFNIPSDIVVPEDPMDLLQCDSCQ